MSTMPFEYDRKSSEVFLTEFPQRTSVSHRGHRDFHREHRDFFRFFQRWKYSIPQRTQRFLHFFFRVGKSEGLRDKIFSLCPLWETLCVLCGKLSMSSVGNLSVSSVGNSVISVGNF